jgi:DNA replication protein
MVNEAADSSVPIEDALLGQLLVRVGDLSELKAVLHVVRLAAQRASPLVPVEALLIPAVVRSIAPATTPEPAPERVQRSVDQAIADGLLLRITIHSAEGPRVHVLASTEANRALVDRLRSGDVGAEQQLGLPTGAALSVHRPNVFALYERHIGPLTPLVAEELRDAERSYPRSWIEEAIQLAVDYNRRNWRYVRSILRGWEERGSPDPLVRRY